MTVETYDAVLRSKGFIFEESQQAWTQHRGKEYKYTHPKYKSYFYIKRISDEDGSPYGFNAQITNGKILDELYPHNEIDTFRDKGQYMWVDEGFIELMKRLPV